jgi:hypothetical protein
MNENESMELNTNEMMCDWLSNSSSIDNEDRFLPSTIPFYSKLGCFQRTRDSVNSGSEECHSS